MLTPPLDVIESWPPPNHANPTTRGYANIIANLILFPLVLLIVSLRMYTRLRISKSVGLDDWFIVAAVVCLSFPDISEKQSKSPKLPAAVFVIISLITERHFGWNRHIWDVEFSTLPPGLKVIMATLIMFDLGTSLTKLSTLTLTYRIIGSGSKVAQNLVIATIGIVGVEMILFMFIVLFQCR